MERKFFMCFIILLALAGLTASAQEGYSGPGLDPLTVEEAKNLRDDSPVLLQGKITRFLGDEKYLFSDDSGTITIEIEHRLWKGLSVNQDDLVEIIGEVDKDFRKIEIEVDSIRKI
jgi:uncharacterized protein (TIGR00156 family)